MGIVVGGDKAWKVRTSKGIVIAYHWVNQEPAMVLFPLRRRLGAAAYIIPQSMAYKYADRSGYPTKRCLIMAETAAQVMAMDTTHDTIKAIVEVILDGLEDLIRMPDDPPAVFTKKPPTIGEGKLIIEGQTIAETEIGDVPALLH